MFAFLVVLMLLNGSCNSITLKYDITARYMADPEPYVTYKEPTPYEWRAYIVDAQNLGLLFAGKTEFSWLLDLRVDNTEQEEWSTGNLITQTHILTTCKAATLLMKLEATADKARATFCQLYLWEYLENNNYLIKDWPYGGTRKIDQYTLHGFCDVKTLKWDIAVIKINNVINPALPFIGYMPVLVDPTSPDKLPEVDLSRMLKQRRMCFVGAIGRPYYNWAYHLVQDFKVRFRVYYDEWSQCSDRINKLCDSSIHDCDALKVNTQAGKKWSCFRTRARVGTVCDHDRGAPLVCNDEVVGFVAFGAKFKYCNDRFPMQFVVAGIHQFSQFITQYQVFKKANPS